MYKELTEYLKKDIYPFHMPGHKRNKNFFPENLWELDITEIGSEVELQQAQQYAAQVFGADRSYYLMNGSSSGIIAAVMAVCGDNDGIIAARNSHSSLFNSLVFSGALPVYIKPSICEDGLAGGVSPQAVEATIKANPHTKAVFVTSPTYEGFVSDVAKISEIVHNYGKMLIVDEAHGAHFAFSRAFPASAVSLDADIVIQSLHKTLPSMNPSAMLHVNGGRVDIQRLEQCIEAVQTTSPSYVVLGMAERCIELLSSDKGTALFNAYEEHLDKFRKAVGGLEKLRLLGTEAKGQADVFDVDIGKLVFNIESDFLNGKDVQNILKEEHRLEIEMSGIRHIVAMTSVADTDEGFHRLKEALLAVDKNIPKGGQALPIKQYGWNIPALAIPPRKTRCMKLAAAKLEKSAGMIAGKIITPYPPGIPLVAPGEIITTEIIEYILFCKELGICVNGVDNGVVIVLE